MLSRSRREADKNVGQIPVSRVVHSGSRPHEISSEQQSVNFGQGDASKLVQNHLILEEVTSYLSLSDLKQFRLVSQQWNRESLPIIQKRVCSINLIPGSDGLTQIMQRRLQIDNNWDRKTAEEFVRKEEAEAGRLPKNKYFLVKDAVKYGKMLLKLIKRNSAGFPCAKFGLSTEILQVDKWLFYNLLETVSSFATKLELYVKHDKVTLNMRSLQFPSLRVLKLREDDWISDKLEETFKCFQHIIRNAPLLESIYLKVVNDSETPAVDFLTAISSSPIRGQLRALDFRTDIMDEHLLALREMGLRLTKFGVEFRGCSEVSSESVISFLGSQSANLEKLRLENLEYKISEEFPLRLPRMQKLSVLKLEVSQANFPELSFSRDLPALKHLEFRTASYYYPRMLNDVMEPQNTLETLVIIVCLDNFEVMNQVARIFPKLKKLECGRLEEVRRTVGNGLDNLEELLLHVEMTTVDKKAMNTFVKMMTGYSSMELEKIEKRWKASGELRMERNKRLTEFLQKLKVCVRSWSAGGELRMERNKRPTEFLQKLKVLRIYGAKLTDVHFLLGPLKLRSLKCLDLRKSTDSKVSQRVLDQMWEKFTVLIEDDCVIHSEENK